MPIATRKEELVRRELKTCPPDGYVVLRQLSYDEMLERRDGASKMLMEGGVRDSNPQMAVQILNRWSNEYTFPRCVVEHNLTDKNGVLLDFSNPRILFKHLDPRVGTEIEAFIDELNNAEEIEPDFTSAPNGSSQDETDKQSDSLEAS